MNRKISCCNIDGLISIRYWHKNGKIHKDNNEPAFIAYRNDGTILYHMWYKNGKPYRDNNESTLIWYNTDGTISSQDQLSDDDSDDNSDDDSDDDGDAVSNAVSNDDSDDDSDDEYEKNEEYYKNKIETIIYDSYIGEKDCYICYSNCNEMIITPCQHVYCKSCVHSWIMTKKSICPYCRQIII